MSRFYSFILAYEDIPRPREGDGAHPGFPGSGWSMQWSLDDARLPGSQLALERKLNRNGQSTAVDVDRSLPVRGVSWYIALAFCIWDGGRLPTEAEHALAAFGGSERREYPWPDMEVGPAIDLAKARYSTDDMPASAPVSVGSYRPAHGLYDQEDLAGNVAEWVSDVYQLRLEARCAHAAGDGGAADECWNAAGSDMRVVRGGSYKDDADALRNAHRIGVTAGLAEPWLGFRCARDF